VGARPRLAVWEVSNNKKTRVRGGGETPVKLFLTGVGEFGPQENELLQTLTGAPSQ
jgi:hypothetical protein